MKKIKELKLYIIKFYKNIILKVEIYFFSYAIKNKDYLLIIIIIYNKYTIFINNKI